MNNFYYPDDIKRINAILEQLPFFIDINICKSVIQSKDYNTIWIRFNDDSRMSIEPPCKAYNDFFIKIYKQKPYFGSEYEYGVMIQDEIINAWICEKE